MMTNTDMVASTLDAERAEMIGLCRQRFADPESPSTSLRSASQSIGSPSRLAW